MTNDTQISDREREILKLVATGSTNQQIADRLNISVNTVKVHLRNIFGKIGAVSRTEATVYAIRNGLVDVEDQVAVAPSAEPPGPEPADEPAPLTTPAPPARTPPAPLTAQAEPAPPPAARRTPGYLPWLGLALAAALIAGYLAWRALQPQPTPAVSGTAAPADAALSERWTVHTPLPRARQGFAVAAYDLESRLYVVGGRQGGQALPLLDRYDPKTGRWVSLADKPTAVSEIQAVALRGKIYVPGGELSDGTVSDALEAYNPREERWESLSPLPAARSRYGLVVWEGKIYLMGGWDGQQFSDALFVYEPESDTWSPGPALPTPRRYAEGSVVAGQIYLVGGESADGALRDSLRLDPSEDGGRWDSITPMPQAVRRPHTAPVLSSLVVIDSESLASWQYDMSIDDWVPSYPIPLAQGGAAGVAFLSTSLFFVADDQAAAPGGVGEYRVLYNAFVPDASNSPRTP